MTSLRGAVRPWSLTYPPAEYLLSKVIGAHYADFGCGHDLAMRPVSAELWVTPWTSDRAIVIDLEKQEQIAELTIGRTRSHKHVAFSEDGREAWISEPESGSLFAVDTRTRRVVDTIALGGHPHHVRSSAGRVYVADGPSDLVVLDAASRQVLARLAVGAEVHDATVVARRQSR